MGRIFTRIVALVLALSLVGSCSFGPSEEANPLGGFRDLEPDSTLSYNVVITQRRTASGLGEPKTLVSRIRLVVEEQQHHDDFSVLVRDAVARGEPSQVAAAERIVGHIVHVSADPEVAPRPITLIGSTDDVPAADIALIQAAYAPLIPEPRAEPGTRWRARPRPVSATWADEPLRFDVDHRIERDETVRGLGSARVRSRALANIRFTLPLVVERSADGEPGGSDDLIVNQLFDALFADVDNPIGGAFAAIAAIPLAILAPFLAFGEAIGGLFGDSDDDDGPEIPTISLVGPLSIDSTTTVWRADGRVLSSRAKAHARLGGNMPDLPGKAAELSGTPLKLDTEWEIVRTMTSPWPEPRPIPGESRALLIAALLSVLAGALAAALRTRRARRDTRKPVRDTVGPRPEREPELADA